MRWIDPETEDRDFAAHMDERDSDTFLREQAEDRRAGYGPLVLVGGGLTGIAPHQGTRSVAAQSPADQREQWRRTAEHRRVVAALYPRERHLTVVPFNDCSARDIGPDAA